MIMTPRQLLWALANRCYISHLDWHEADAIALDLDSRRPDDKELLESLQEMGQLIANDKEVEQLNDEDKRSCYTCKFHSLCYLRNALDRILLPQAAWMLENAPQPFTNIFDTLAEICNQYQRVEQEAK